MKDELFEELIASVRQGGAILRGEKESSRSFECVASELKSEVATVKLWRDASAHSLEEVWDNDEDTAYDNL